MDSQSYPVLKLKIERDNTINYRHPWLFSGALELVPWDIKHGELVYLANSDNKIVATGTYSKESMIAVRIFEFKEAIIDEQWFVNKFEKLAQDRKFFGYGENTQTTGYRLAFGEADGLPGLVIDRYHDVFVIQLSTAGLENLRPLIIRALIQVFEPQAIVERSDLPVRQAEGLGDYIYVHYGSVIQPVEFLENGIKYLADVLNGQKTGFFLDQKTLRHRIQNLANGAKVLNIFCYSGSASVAALVAGAKSVTQIDISEPAIELSKAQAELNKLDPSLIHSEIADVFSWLSSRREPEFDLVILDPPAMIKSNKDIDSGQKAYHFLNRAALRLVKPGGHFVTSSCSYYFNKDDFMSSLRRASCQNNQVLRLKEIVRQSPDHPISLYFPESSYLKSFICQLQ